MNVEEPAFVEDCCFTLPALENGPTAIGGLWNCHNSTTVHGCNLFGQALSGEHLRVDPVHADEYMLRHVKSTSDRQKSLRVEGEISLELLFGLIKIGGDADHERNDQTSVYEEELLCTYDLTTCSVETLPSIKETIDPVVLENILKGITKATHVVVATKYGAKVSAIIRVRETNYKSKEDTKGHFLGKLMLGPITAAAKVHLALLDTEAKNSFEKTIKISSRPEMNAQPTAIEEMFSIVSSIHDVVNKNIGFKTDEYTVHGVPIRFTLVPIQQFIDVPIERLYIQFKDTVLEALTGYLTFLKDFQVFPIVHKKVLEAEPALRKVLYDPENPLTKSIRKSEDEYKSTAKEFYTELGNILKEYKFGKKDCAAIMAVVQKMEKSISMPIVLEQVGQFVQEGRTLLNSITDADIDDSHKIELFTNELELEKWYQPQKPIKILLRTGKGGISSYALATIYSLSSQLNDIGIKVGVALPNISKNQNSLALKVNGSEELYNNEKIQLVVQVLELLVNKSGPIATRYFTIYASSAGIKLPFKDNLDDLHSLINILDGTKTVTIAESYLETRDLCLKSDGRMKFMVNLECLDSAAECVSKLQYLQLLYGDKGDWVVGKWDFPEVKGLQDSPIVFAFKNQQLHAVCCDILDLLFLNKSFEETDNDNSSFTKLLQTSHEKGKSHYFYKQRAQYALIFGSKFQSKGTVFDNVAALTDLTGFEMVLNDNTIFRQHIQALLRCVLSQNWQGIYLSLIEFISRETEEAEDILKTFQLTLSEDIDTTKLADALQSVLESQNPFYGFVSATIDSIKAIKTKDNQMHVLDKLAKGVANHDKCPRSLKEQLTFLEDLTTYSDRLTKTVQRLENYKTVHNSDPKLENIAKLIVLLKAPAAAREKVMTVDILPQMLSQIRILDAEYPGADSYLQTCIASNNFYGALQLLTKIQVHPSLYHIQNAFEKLSRFDDLTGLANIMETLAKARFSDEQYESIFNNQKIQLLLKNASQSHTFLEKIKSSSCSRGIPNYFPGFLREEIESLFDTNEEEELKPFLNFEDTVFRFQRISNREQLPNNFAQVLMESLLNNLRLKNIFLDSGALEYWDDSTKQFKEAWDCNTVKAAYEKLVEWKLLQDSQPDDRNQYYKFLPTEFETSTPVSTTDDVSTEQQPLEAGSIASLLMGDTLTPILPADFLRLTALLQKPNPIQHFDDGYLSQLIPFVLQSLKMWGLQTINPEILSSFVKLPEKKENKMMENNNKINFGGKGTVTKKVKQGVSSISLHKVKPISKIDLFSCLLTRCHPLIFQDILKIVSLFSMTLPLILRDIRQTNTKSFFCLIPLLKACSTKWEYRAGVVRYNELFTSPFKMIVCVRVGSTAPQKPGKSSILNQVLSRNTFSSLSDPGSEHGKPYTLDGSVEFCTLTQETSTPMLWQSAIQPHYATGTDQVLLLANLHGDVLEYPETVEFLKKVASKFVIFFNSMSRKTLEEKYIEIEERFGVAWSNHLYHILVDPYVECEDLLPDRVINTSQLVSDATSRIIRTVLSCAISDKDFREESKTNIENVLRFDPTKGIIVAQEIATPESLKFINFVRRLGCQQVKSAMKLQKMDPKLDSYQKNVGQILKDSSVLRELIVKFYEILRLPINRRLIAISHIDKQLSYLTAEESTKIRNRILELREEKIRSMSLVKTNESEHLQQLVDVKLVSAFEELDKISLGLEHIYREVGRVFAYNQSFKNNSFSNIASSVGELLVHGNAIEVLDGEILDMCGSWFNSVCHTICKTFGSLKIFVVSIIGLQSSGKSTLLNALFACKFAVSVGRCTRGLFMRILFLEKELAAELGVDAIVVLDTEGLGAPEKLNDENCEQKDRLLATFTMSVSNLTLINVLGESIRDLSDILQIVIVTMARLEKADISPDICMVQHLSERDTSKVMQGETEFANALHEAVALTEKKDMKMGIRNSKSIKMLEQRIKNGELAKLFPPFKNGATVNAPPSEKYHEAVTDLYNMILQTIKKTKVTQTFHGWHEIIHSYWDAVSKQDYALRFKNIKEIQDFIERGASIANVKSIVDDAFRKHREDFSRELRATFNKFVHSKKPNIEWERMKEEFTNQASENLKQLPHNCPTSCTICAEACEQRGIVFSQVEGKACEQETQDTIFRHIQQSRIGILKHLNQMADALVVAHGNSAEFDQIIAGIIQRKSKSRYTEAEVEKFIDEIWLSVRRVVSTKIKVIPVFRQILDEISDVYRMHPNIVAQVRAEILPNLKEMKAMKSGFFSDPRLDFKQASYLEDQLEGITENVIIKFDSKQFETGMVYKISELMEELLFNFEAYVKEKLRPDFKWQAIVFGLIKFARVMKENEKEWNDQNNPLHILEKREDEYRKKIKIWLQHGFGYESEGNLIGEKIISAIRQLAQKQGDQEHVKFVCGHSWLISSENIRLEYFLGLAKEVQAGQKRRAIDHFASPKFSITNWFNNKVNALPRDKGVNVFQQTADMEFDRATQAIRNIGNAEALRDFVKDYLTQVEGVEYNPQSLLDFTKATEAEFQIFKLAALKKLEAAKGSLRKNINITCPSKQEKVQKILGCCENCYWCGALCWGEFGHQNNRDDTKKHHTCHQSQGLIGIKNRNDKSLTPESCDMLDGNWTVWWHNCRDGMKWPDAKLHSDFSNWLFTLHSKNLFNYLMKWFFANLHNDIAAAKGFKPAHQAKLIQLGFSNLPSLNHIASEIESRLGKK